MALAGSLAFALYETGYQKYAALPAASIDPKQVPTTPTTRSDFRSRQSLRKLKEDGRPSSYSPTRGSASEEEEEEEDDEQDASDRPIYLDENGKLDPQTFLAHANTVTAGIGLATFLILWIPVPILHYTGIEVFELPKDGMTYLYITGNVVCGVIFNAGFM